jgi:hypothetical protein
MTVSPRFKIVSSMVVTQSPQVESYGVSDAIFATESEPLQQKLKKPYQNSHFLVCSRYRVYKSVFYSNENGNKKMNHQPLLRREKSVSNYRGMASTR